jgi:hypothetical protein
MLTITHGRSTPITHILLCLERCASREMSGYGEGEQQLPRMEKGPLLLEGVMQDGGSDPWGLV